MGAMPSIVLCLFMPGWFGGDGTAISVGENSAELPGRLAFSRPIVAALDVSIPHVHFPQV